MLSNHRTYEGIEQMVEEQREEHYRELIQVLTPTPQNPAAIEELGLKFMRYNLSTYQLCAIHRVSHHLLNIERTRSRFFNMSVYNSPPESLGGSQGVSSRHDLTEFSPETVTAVIDDLETMPLLSLLQNTFATAPTVPNTLLDAFRQSVPAIANPPITPEFEAVQAEYNILRQVCKERLITLQQTARRQIEGDATLVAVGDACIEYSRAYVEMSRCFLRMVRVRTGRVPILERPDHMSTMPPLLEASHDPFVEL